MLRILVLLMSVAALLAGDVCQEGCNCGTGSAIACRNIHSVPQVLGKPTVQSLDLAQCSLATLEDKGFSSFPNVQSLTLQSCKILKISAHSFQDLAKLQQVDLSYNFIRSIPADTFVSNPSLEKVILNDNPLVRVPPDAPILVSKSITSLDLKNCKLYRLSAASFSKLSNLTSLDLSDNKLQTLTTDTLASLRHISSVNLEDNMWACGKEFKRILCWSHYEEMACLKEDGSFTYVSRSECENKIIEKVKDPHYDIVQDLAKKKSGHVLLQSVGQESNGVQSEGTTVEERDTDDILFEEPEELNFTLFAITWFICTAILIVVAIFCAIKVSSGCKFSHEDSPDKTHERRKLASSTV